jgi:hypothetical protein
MSDDGMTFCGFVSSLSGNNPALGFVATVPSPGAVAAFLCAASMYPRRRRAS